MIGIEIDTSDHFADLTADEEARFFRAGKQAVRNATNRLRRAIRKNLRMIGHGETYMVNGRLHVASAPGEPPAKLTGELARSIRTSVRLKRREGRIDGVVQPSKSQRGKGRWLEFGTATIAPRPFMRPAMLQEESGMSSDLQQSVND